MRLDRYFINLWEKLHTAVAPPSPSVCAQSVLTGCTGETVNFWLNIILHYYLAFKQRNGFLHCLSAVLFPLNNEIKGGGGGEVKVSRTMIPWMNHMSKWGNPCFLSHLLYLSCILWLMFCLSPKRLWCKEIRSVVMRKQIHSLFSQPSFVLSKLYNSFFTFSLWNKGANSL